MYRRNDKKRVDAYCRVSTDFTDQLNSLATQRSYFNDYINDHEEWELVEIYYDEGYHRHIYQAPQGLQQNDTGLRGRKDRYNTYKGSQPFCEKYR